MSATGDILDQIDKTNVVRGDLEVVLAALQTLHVPEKHLLGGCLWSINRSAETLEEISGKLSEALARVKEGAA